MKVVQRDTQLILFKLDGLLVDGGSSTFDINICIGKNDVFTLMGFSVKYEYYCDADNGSIEFETRDFYAIDLEGKKVSSDELYKIVEESADNSYSILVSECRKKDSPYPSKHLINNSVVLYRLGFELNEYYSSR